LIAFATLTGYAAPQAPASFTTASPDQVRASIKQVEATRRIPITGLLMAEVGGQKLLMSENGRFVIVGDFRLLDVWNGIEVKTVEDAAKLNRIDLGRIGVKDTDFAQVVLGTGTKQVYVFLDPWCEHCHDLISQMEPLKEKYTFHLVMAPVLGQKSVDTVKRIVCTPDKPKALQALIKQEYDGLPPFAGCDLSQLQKTLITTRMIGIDGVPYLILPSKTTHRGGTKDLAALLNEDDKAAP
jgi:thiol:disulfide interchange protein DsbC